jgi:hypothetical protein
MFKLPSYITSIALVVSVVLLIGEYFCLRALLKRKTQGDKQAMNNIIASIVCTIALLGVVYLVQNHMNMSNLVLPNPPAFTWLGETPKGSLPQGVLTPP